MYTNFKIIQKNFINSVAVTASTTSLMLIFYPLPKTAGMEFKLICTIGFFVANVAIALIFTRSKNRLTIQTSPKTKVNIIYRDIFSMNGIIVIPVNEYFDTKVDDRIISSNTVHGLFVKKLYGGNVEELNREIEKQLSGVQGKDDVSRSEGKKVKYPLGTTIRIDKDGKVYLLCALTTFDSNNKAYCRNDQYLTVLNSLMYYVHAHNQGRPVNMPLIGAGAAGVGLNKQQLLENLVNMFEVNNYVTIPGGVNITLHESVKAEINLNAIDYMVQWRRK